MIHFFLFSFKKAFNQLKFQIVVSISYFLTFMRFLHTSKQNCHSEVDELKVVFDKFEM